MPNGCKSWLGNVTSNQFPVLETVYKLIQDIFDNNVILYE